MTNPTPPGWYPDGTGTGGQRWWDGTQWSTHVQSPYQPASAIPRAPAGTSPNTPQIWWIVAIFAAQLLFSTIYLATFDWGGYLHAMSPTVLQDGNGGNPAIISMYASIFSPAYFAMLGVSFLGYAGTVTLAYFDTKTLAARAIERPFPWALSFIPSYGSMVYVIGRSVVVKRRTGSGLAPLWVYIAVFVFGMVVSVAFAVGGMASMMAQLREYGVYN